MNINFALFTSYRLNKNTTCQENARTTEIHSLLVLMQNLCQS